MARLYGSLNNRLEENHNYTGRELKAGDDITMYYWSDRHCYYITKVINQKRIFVKKYEVVADREKVGGQGHQNWLYFKTTKECNEYLKKYFPNDNRSDIETREEEWVYRYGGWYEAMRYTKATWEKCLENAAKDCKDPNNKEAVYNLARLYFRLGDEDLNKVLSGKEIVKYIKLQPVSFGVKDYYYDWEF